MNEPIPESPPPILGPDDPPTDFGRERAAYEKKRDRLVREHLGQIALVDGDEVVRVWKQIRWRKDGAPDLTPPGVEQSLFRRLARFTFRWRSVF